MTQKEFKMLKPGDLVVYKSKGTVISKGKSYMGLVLEVEHIGITVRRYDEYNGECYDTKTGIMLKQPGFDEGFRTEVCVPQQLDIYRGCAK